MTKFNVANKPENELTYADVLEPAMNITDKEDAQQYLKAYVEYIERHRDDAGEHDKSAEQIAKSNLGYYAGYYSHEIRNRVEQLFKCSHPVFGSIKENGAPTGKQAFELGLKMGEKIKNQK